MKTTNDIKYLNYNDLSFFLGISPMDAKWEIAQHLFTPSTIPVTSKGAPKIKISDQVETDKIDFTIRSNSALDGSCRFTYLVDYYNKGITMDALRNFGENKTFIKKLKFTGKFEILNEIMNDEQYLKLQKIWLFASVYGKSKPSKNASEFIKANEWSKDYLESRGIVFN